MKRFATTLMLALIFSIAPMRWAYAIPSGLWIDRPIPITYSAGTPFTAVDISGGVTTDPIWTYGYRFLKFDLDYVYSAATAVTMTCQESDSPAGTYRDIQGLVASGTTLNSAVLTWSQLVAANEDWPWTLTLLGYEYVKCTFTAVGGGAADTLTAGAVIGE